jgi:O-antigen/teichoic acid export membrane protein
VNYRLLARDTVVYGGADLTAKLIAFLTFPLLASALSPFEFGVVELVGTTLALIAIIANVGLNNAVHRYYWDPETLPDSRPNFVSSGLIFLVLSVGGTCALGLLLVHVAPTWPALFGSGISYTGLIAALLMMFANHINQYCLDIIRLHHKPWRFFAVSLVGKMLAAPSALAAVIILDLGVDGLFGAQALVALLALPVAVWAIKKDLVLRFDLAISKRLLEYGHPFIFAGLAYWLFGSMDRWMLAWLSSVEEVGIYSVASRFASVVLFISTAFGQAWSPVAMKIRLDNTSTYRLIFGDILIVLCCGMLLASAGVALFAYEIIWWLLPHQYISAALPTSVLCLGVAFQATIQVTAVGISIERRTHLFARLSWVAVGVNFLLNLLLIPRYGALGAAWATLASYMLLSGSYLFFTQRLHPLIYSNAKLIGWVICLLSVGLCSSFFSSYVDSQLGLYVRITAFVTVAIVCVMLVPWRRLSVTAAD